MDPTATGGPEHAAFSPRRSGLRSLLSRVWRAPFLLLTLTVLFWSGNFVVGRAVAGLVPPVALAYWRWTLGLILVVAFGWRHIGRDLRTLLRAWPMLLLLALLGVAAFNTLVYVGLQSTTAINALLMQSAMPLVILAATFVLFGERPGIGQAAGVVISLAGVAAIAAKGDRQTLATLQFNVGDIWVLVAVVAYAVYSALLRKRPAVHPLSFLGATFLIGSLMLLPLYIREYLFVARIEPVMPAYIAIAYVAIFPGFLSYLFYNRGVELAGANKAGHFMHLMPIFGSLLAVALLGEEIAMYHLMGALLIGGGLSLATLTRR